MNSNIIEIVRHVVQQEMARTHSNLLGVVSQVFPRTDPKDDNNYEVNVKLKHENLELRKVPVAVAHVGIAAPPRMGDLVLVQFINGDLNQPVITGRFYTDDTRAPLFEENEILFEQRINGGGSLNHLRFKPDGTIYLQRDVKKPEDNSEALTSIRIDGASGDLEIKMGDKVTLTLKNDTTIQIETDDMPISVKCKELNVEGKMNVKGDVKIEGETNIKGDTKVEGAFVAQKGGKKTTIEGNEITGG
jgi:phage baseplate assembly protein gpV